MAKELPTVTMNIARRWFADIWLFRGARTSSTVTCRRFGNVALRASETGRSSSDC
jgi:hypothetical protein